MPRPTQRDSVGSTLRSLPQGARPTEVWRGAASSILRLNPKECEALTALFEEELAGDERRALVLDLLAGAGTPEAQAVMRRILSLPSARVNNRRFASYVQSLGRLEEPDGQTLRFLVNVYREAKNEPHDVRAACAYALGAAIGQAVAAGDVMAATRASEVLRADLLEAGDALAKCALLTALGNAGLPSDLRTIFRHAPDADPLVRSAVALALRKIHEPEARSQLLTMLADPACRVAQSALSALAEHDLNEDDLHRLAELVLAGRTALALDGRILRVLVAQLARMTPAIARSKEIEEALRLLLGRVEAAVQASGGGSGERRIPSSPPPDSEMARSTIPSPFPRASGAVAPLPYSGGYRMVQDGRSSDRLRALGLDVDARISSIPLPPKRNPSPLGTGTVLARPMRQPLPAAIIRRR